MTSPLSTVTTGTVSPSPSPLIERIFGEARFHTDGDVAALIFDKDDSLWSIDETGVLKHWNIDAKLLARNFLSDLETLWVFSSDARYLASGNDDLLLWEVESGQLLARTAQDSWITALAFRPDGAVLASGHDDGNVRLWDVATQRCHAEIPVHPRHSVSALAFSPKGDLLATAGEDRVIRIWKSQTLELWLELKSHTDRIPALVWSPDGTHLISAGWDTSARVWQPPHPDPLMLLNSHADQVLTLAYSPDGRFLACADSDHDIYLWSEPAKGKVGHILRGHQDEIRCLAFNADGRLLASAGADRVIRLWEVQNGRLLAGPHATAKHSLAYVPGARSILVSATGQAVRAWDAASGDECPPTGEKAAYSVAASPDGRQIALGGTDHFTSIWDVESQAVVAQLEATKPPIGRLAYSPDGTLIAHTSPADGLVWIWNAKTFEPQLILIEAADGCTLEALAIHPNGQWLACGGVDVLSTGERDGALCIWDITTMEKKVVWDVGVYALAFDPRGKYLAGAGLKETVYLWDLEKDELIFELAGFQGAVNAVAFSPDGSYLLAAGEDMTVRAWDVLSSRMLIRREFDTAPQSLLFSPDGRFLFLGNANTTCYQVEFKKLLDD